MKHAVAALAWIAILLIGGVGTAQAASTWNAAAAQKLEPEPMEGDFQFAAIGTDGSEIAGWNHFTTGTRSTHQALTITPRGQAFQPALDASPDSFYYNDMRFSDNDMRFSANTKGDLATMFAYLNPEDENETVYGYGTRAAGSNTLSVHSLDRQATGDESKVATHVVSVDVGINGDVVVAYLGKGLSVWASVGKVGGSFSRPARLTLPGHNASDEVEVDATIDQDGRAFVVWRDVLGSFPFTGPEPRGTIVYAQGEHGAFTTPQSLTPANEDAHTPLTVARNDFGDVVIAWGSGAAYRRRGRGVGGQERHGLYRPSQAAVDPDGVAYIAGVDAGDKNALQVAARPVNGRFLAPQSIPLGGEPHFTLTAPGRGAGIIAATGFESGHPHPVTVRLITADGHTGAPTTAINPDRPVNRIAFDIRPTDGAALLMYGLDAGQPLSQLFAERGDVDLQAPERNIAQLVTPSAGSVQYRVAGATRFGTLGGRGLVPDKSEIAATARKVDLTVSRLGQRETVSLSGSRFVTRQVGTSRSPSTELRLSSFTCPSSSSVRGRAAAKRRRKQSLFGRGKGHYTTKGHWGSASVRGTTWRTEDTCDYTKVSVTTGTVSVRDFVRHRTVTVRTGHSYTARRTR